jgi:glycerophosphoryl diester phosphodiesterase
MTSWTGKYPVMVVAHRGFSGKAPENTLVAFRRAIHAGSDMMEFDVRLSKDGEVVIIHDEELDRTTTGRGRVADYSLRELRKLDAGSVFGKEFAGEKIPLLREALQVAQKRILVNIEIKDGYLGGYTLRDVASKTFQAVEDAGMSDQVIFSSFYPPALETIREQNPQARLAFLFHYRWTFPEQVTAGKSFTALNLRRTYLNKGKIAGIHERGMKVNVYTVNSGEEMERFVRWGVDGIITNHPDLLIKILKKNF